VFSLRSTLAPPSEQHVVAAVEDFASKMSAVQDGARSLWLAPVFKHVPQALIALRRSV
jgi:hypothetical protein